MNEKQDYDVDVKRRITIARNPHDLYHAWRSPKRLAGFMAGVLGVRELDNRRQYWTVRVPGFGLESWEAEITDDRENEAIGWQTVGETRFRHRGLVTFTPGINEPGTEVSLQISMNMPGGAVAGALSRLARRSPEDYISHTLRNFKRYMETGEIANNRGPAGRMRNFTGVGPKIAMAGAALAVLAALVYSRRTAGGKA